MNTKNITLISFGYIEKNFLEIIAQDIEIEYQHPTVIKESRLDLSDFLDNTRRQYDANKLLKVVDSMFPPESIKIIGLFTVDLFIPIMTYIFGQAFLNGRSGIASLYRLTNERYGMKPDNKLLLDRFRKEVIHELGHTFGLIHCHTPACVMRSSTYVEDIDQKKLSLCAKCKQETAISALG